MKVIKNESPLHERLKNLHWVLSHKVGVYIELGSPSGGFAFFPIKAMPDNLARCRLYVHSFFVHMYTCITVCPTPKFWRHRPARPIYAHFLVRT